MNMYRDLVGEVEKIQANGKVWYYQQINRWDGNLKAVILYDDNGDYVSEFQSMEELEKFVTGENRT